MDPDHSLPALGILLCLLILALMSAAEAALTTISRHRLSALHEEGVVRMQVLRHLLSEPYRLKATILLLNTAMIITATALTLKLTLGLSLWVQIGGLTALLFGILILSEMLPRALALNNPAGTARVLSGPMALLTTLMRPVVWLTEVIFRPFTRIIGAESAHPLVTEEELRLLVNVGEEEGLIERDERQMIEGIFSFGDTLVREVMIPRVDVVALEHTATPDQALETILRYGHSRIPVYRGSIDHIIGILYAKDLLGWLHSGRVARSLEKLVRPAHFVPETMKVDELLRDLQTRKVHLAIAVDEYGGTSGLATIEDLLEEIVGEIQDEYDTEEPGVQVVRDGVVLVEARQLIDDINAQFELNLSSDESDRIGGLVFEQLGRLPRVGDQVELPGDITLTVVSVDGLRPRQLQLTFPTIAEEEEESAGAAERTERRTAPLRARQRGETAP